MGDSLIILHLFYRCNVEVPATANGRAWSVDDPAYLAVPLGYYFFALITPVTILLLTTWTGF